VYEWKNSEWDYVGDIGPCSYNHENGTCIQSTLSHLECPRTTGCGGEAWLKVKIDLSKINGTDKKLKYISVVGRIDKAWGFIGELRGGIEIYADDNKIFDGLINYGDGKFIKNEWNVDIDLENYKSLDVKIWHWARVWLGSVEIHTARPTIEIEYDAFVPPKKYNLTVKVIDKTESNPVIGAKVTLLRRDELVDEGITDRDGIVEFFDLDENGYKIIVEHPNYYSGEGFVKLDSNKYIIVKLLRKPSMWERFIEWLQANWWWVSIIGIVFGIFVLAPSLIPEAIRTMKETIKASVEALRGEKGAEEKRK